MDMMKSFELYQTEEFKALCKLLGIEWEKATLGLTIEIGPDPDQCVKITHSYFINKPYIDKLQLYETTNQHNKEFRTFQ